MADNSPQVQQAMQLQSEADAYCEAQGSPVQRMQEQNGHGLQKGTASGPSVAQLAYGPTQVNMDDADEKIKDVDIIRPGSRPNVAAAAAGGFGQAYRHHTNWAVIRDSIAHKYVGLTLEQAIRKLERSLGYPEHLQEEVSKAKFLQMLKLEMGRESQFGAAGDSDENSQRNNAERSAEAQTRNDTHHAGKFGTWVNSALDIAFHRAGLGGQAKLMFDLKAFTGHVMHSIRAVLYRSQKGTDPERARYTHLAARQSLATVIRGTLASFGETDFRFAIINCYLQSKHIDASQAIDSFDIHTLDDAMKDYVNFHSILMDRFFHAENGSTYEEVQHGGYDLENLDSEESAKEKFDNAREMAAENAMSDDDGF